MWRDRMNSRNLNGQPIELHQRLREALPHCTFRPPATKDQLRRVERELGITLLEDIRRLYLHYDGFHCGGEARVELLPLIGPEPRKAGEESVLSWNQFRRGPGWEKGYEPPEHVLELGFLNDDEYIGIDLRNGMVMVVFRRGNEVEPAGRDLCEVLVEEYEDQRRFHEELQDRVWKGRVLYNPVKPAEGPQRDIDRIVLRYLEARPAAYFLRQLTEDAAEPGGNWILSVGFDPGWEEIRLKSPTGNCPFIVESDVSETNTTATTVEQAVSTILAEVAEYLQRWQQRTGDQA
jgi:hypothetical protein